VNHPRRKTHRFEFVIDELWPLRPSIKNSFGITFVYVGEKLVVGLRDSSKLPNTNGVWLFTSVEHLDSLKNEFPTLPRQYFWKSNRNAWLILASKLEQFEEHALKACGLILDGDKRIGRPTRGARQFRPGQLMEL
jgi:hypothetical protein